ncbi:MAG: AAA family ATPase [Oscillospiraceae bacterium]|nr:AAA family ATPase [Oscillospiraceae bacterium]
MDRIDYIGTSKAAEMLHMTTRRVVGLCHEGKFNGAVQDGRNWKIPEESVRAYMGAAGMSGSLLPCAVGNTSYVEISSECYYVDKTLLIRDLVDDHNMVTLFTRPRRFGKTLAINMLKTFFEKTDEDTSKYFADKKIWQCGQKYRSLQGTYPVIMLTFKDIKFDNWQDSLEAIRLILKDEYKRHPELPKSDMLGADDKDYLLRMEKGTLTDVEYSRALLNLTRMLAVHHRRNVVILIDEYDTPIQHGYTRGFYQDVIAFMRNFLSGGLKDNPDLAFGVLTGIMRVSKENLFSGLNNLTVNTVLDDKYSSCFGFTGDEVQEMADYYGKSDGMQEIRRWYDGYRFGKSEIYNPWSVTGYFANDGQAKAFWANTSDNEIIREILQDLTPEVSDQLTRIMQDEEIHAALNMEVVYPQMSDGADTVFSFLLLAGYLTLSSDTEETEFGTFAALRIPNMEIRRVYNTEVLGWMKTRSTGGVIPELEKAIYLGDGKRLEKALRDYMISCISAFDGASEGFYHGMMLGLVASLSSKYYIRSNRESGDGRFDLQMEPKERMLPGIVMEFKSVPASEKKDLPVIAEEAIAQIDRQNYTRELEDRGVKKIIKYGIAFSGKSVEVKTNSFVF